MRMISVRRGGFFQGWLLFVLALLLISAVTGWFVARSPGFRQLVAERLSDRTGLSLQIAESYIGWPYVLVLRGVESQEDGAVTIQVREMRLGRQLRQWTLNMRGVRVWFSADVMEDAPHEIASGLVRVARLREAGAIDIMRATAYLQDHWCLRLDDLDIHWLDREGHVAAVVRQLHFRMRSVRLPSGDMTYYRLSYPGAAENAMGSIRDLDWEWLTRGGDHYVELQRSGIAPVVLFYE